MAMNFTLDQLRVFEASVRTGTFAAAARELHRVPSAITYLVHELETALGVALFVRQGRGVTLTHEGQRLLEVAGEVLERARALERAALQLQGGWEAELYVVVDGALPASWLNACLLRFAQPGMATRLRVDVEYQEGVLDPLREGRADLGLYLGFDSDVDAAGFTTRDLPSMELVLVAAATHPLAIGPCDETARNAHAELVVRDSSARFERLSKPSYMGSRHVVYLSDFHAKKGALLSGAGYGWMPRHMIERELADGVLLTLATELHRWAYRPVLVTPSGRTLGPAGTLFAQTLMDSLPTGSAAPHHPLRQHQNF